MTGRARGHRGWLSVVAVMVAVMTMLGPGVWPAEVPAAVAAAVPGLVLAPATGPPGSGTTATGSGFRPGEAVTLTGGGQSLGAATAGAGGGFSVPLVIPSGAPPGPLVVTATGGQPVQQASATFVVNTDWPMLGDSDTRSALNPYENVLGPGNVSSLRVAWTLPDTDYLSDAVVAGGTVYVVDFDSDVLYAVAAGSGKVRWGVPLGAPDTFGSSPAVAGGVVYVGDGAGLHALVAATGRQLWDFPTYNTDAGAPLVAGGVVFTGSIGGFEYAVNATTGKMIWRFGSDDGECFGPAALASGVLYVAADCGAGAYALDARTGKLIWRRSGALASTPTVGAGLVYFSPAESGACETKCYTIALDARTGATRWAFHMPDMETGGDFALSGNTLYATTGLGLVNGQLTSTSDLYAFDATTGAVKWAAPVAGANDQPAVANGVVYVGGVLSAPHQYTGVLSAVSATTGALLWRYTDPGNGGAIRSPIVSNGMVIDALPVLGLEAFSLPANPKAP